MKVFKSELLFGKFRNFYYIKFVHLDCCSTSENVVSVEAFGEKKSEEAVVTGALGITGSQELSVAAQLHFTANNGCRNTGLRDNSVVVDLEASCENYVKKVSDAVNLNVAENCNNEHCEMSISETNTKMASCSENSLNVSTIIDLGDYDVSASKESSSSLTKGLYTF